MQTFIHYLYCTNFSIFSTLCLCHCHQWSESWTYDHGFEKNISFVVVDFFYQLCLVLNSFLVLFLFYIYSCLFYQYYTIKVRLIKEAGWNPWYKNNKYLLTILKLWREKSVLISKMSEIKSGHSHHEDERK